MSSFTMEDREQKVIHCKLCEQAERFDDMLEVINEVAKMPGGLSNDERNLLSVAYKNAISSRRTSWRILSSHEAREAEEGHSSGAAEKKALKVLIEKCEKELETICGQILGILDKHLIASASSPETKVFYQKMKGDYWRYLAEFQAGDKKKKSTVESLKAYEVATEEAKQLPAVNTVRLGLALNFSVFYYEIEEDHKEACRIAQQAYDEASKQAKETGTTGGGIARDRMLIMQLLEDNLNLWSADSKPEEAASNDKKE